MNVKDLEDERHSFVMEVVAVNKVEAEDHAFQFVYKPHGDNMEDGESEGVQVLSGCLMCKTALVVQNIFQHVSDEAKLAINTIAKGAHAVGNQTGEKTKVLIDVGDDNVASIEVKPSNCSLHDCTAQIVSVKGDDDPTLVFRLSARAARPRRARLGRTGAVSLADPGWFSDAAGWLSNGVSNVVQTVVHATANAMNKIAKVATEVVQTVVSAATSFLHDL